MRHEEPTGGLSVSQSSSSCQGLCQFAGECSVRLLVQVLGWEVSKSWCGGSGLVPEVPVRWLEDRFGEFPLAGFGRVLFSKIARADCNHKGALNCSA